MKRLSLAKIEYELPVFLFLLVKAVYTYGILTLFLPVVALLSSSVAVAFLCGKLIRRASPQRKAVAVLFTALLLVSPAATGLFGLDAVMNSAAYYMQTLFGVCLLALIYFAGDSRNTWRVPLLCVVCAVVRPLFVTEYLPLVVMLFLHRRLFVKNSRRDMLFAGIGVAGAIAMFFLFKGNTDIFTNAFAPEVRGELALSALRYAVFAVAIIAVFIGVAVAPGREPKMTVLFAAGSGILPFASAALGLGGPDPFTAAITALTGFLLYLTGLHGNTDEVFKTMSARLSDYRLPVFLALLYTAIFAMA